MGGISKQNINGNFYYYAIETKRIDGKPRVVSKKYLGTYDDIVRKLTEPPQPQVITNRDFGLVAAIFDIAQRLQFVEMVDGVVPKRLQGATVGQYMLIAALNRCVSPTSKNQIGEWYEETVLPRLINVESQLFTSQRFWDNMDLMTTEDIVELQIQLAKKVIETFGVDLRVLLFDATNFFTYIDTKNSCTLPQRGHNKQKRTDLRQIGLALMVSRDGGVPLFFDVYQGNDPDSVEFDRFIRDMVERFNELFTQCEDITVVCDKGNISKDNLEKFDKTPLHIVTSLSHKHVNKDLLNIPLKEYQSCRDSQLEGVKYYRCQEKVYGAERTVILVYNPALYEGQMQGIYHNLNKTISELTMLQKSLAGWKDQKTKGKRPQAESVERHVKKILHRQYMNLLITCQINEVRIEKQEAGQKQQQEEGKKQKSGKKKQEPEKELTWVDLQFNENKEALENLQKTVLGKTILFSDRDDWADEDYIRVYRDQYMIEHNFRQMKDPSWVSWDPLLHWTDQKIRVHAFYCFAALLFASLLRQELRRKKLPISFQRACEKLSRIQECTIEFAPSGRPKKAPHVVMLSSMDKEQKQLFDSLELGRYLG